MVPQESHFEFVIEKKMAKALRELGVGKVKMPFSSKAPRETKCPICDKVITYLQSWLSRDFFPGEAWESSLDIGAYIVFTACDTRNIFLCPNHLSTRSEVRYTIHFCLLIEWVGLEQRESESGKSQHFIEFHLAEKQSSILCWMVLYIQTQGHLAWYNVQIFMFITAERTPSKATLGLEKRCWPRKCKCWPHLSVIKDKVWTVKDLLKLCRIHAHIHMSFGHEPRVSRRWQPAVVCLYQCKTALQTQRGTTRFYAHVTCSRNWFVWLLNCSYLCSWISDLLHNK